EPSSRRDGVVHLSVVVSDIQTSLFSGRPFAAGLLNAVPCTLEFVVGAGVFGPALALAQGVEAVGESDDAGGLVGHLGEQLAGGGFAVLVEGADELVQSFPHGDAG